MEGGANLLFGIIFTQNCMKKKKIGLKGGPLHPLDPPLEMILIHRGYLCRSRCSLHWAGYFLFLDGLSGGCSFKTFHVKWFPFASMSSIFHCLSGRAFDTRFISSSWVSSFQSGLMADPGLIVGRRGGANPLGGVPTL